MANCIFYGLIITVAIVGVLWYFDVFGLRQIASNAYAWFAKSFTSLNLGGLDIGKLISQNLPAIIGTGLGGLGALFTYAKYRGQIEANKTLLDQKLQFATKAASLESQVSTQAETLKMYESDETPFQLQKTIEGLKTEFTSALSAKDGQITSLEEALRLANEKLTSIPYREVTVYK